MVVHLPFTNAFPFGEILSCVPSYIKDCKLYFVIKHRHATNDQQKQSLEITRRELSYLRLYTPFYTAIYK